MARSFLPFDANGWNIIIENLCLYEGQNMDGILKSPVTRVAKLNVGAVNKAKTLAKLRKGRK
ncbi:MAG: hypothetical protein J5960_09610 [Desulfovibrio sp.]|nr:hypothetical protein [Desulfovibrio sp.]